jgi:hypothetical protein
MATTPVTSKSASLPSSPSKRGPGGRSTTKQAKNIEGGFVPVLSTPRKRRLDEGHSDSSPSKKTKAEEVAKKDTDKGISDVDPASSTPLCRSCQKHTVRSTTKSDKDGNQERVFISCGFGCNNFDARPRFVELEDLAKTLPDCSCHGPVVEYKEEDLQDIAQVIAVYPNGYPDDMEQYLNEKFFIKLDAYTKMHNIEYPPKREDDRSSSFDEWTSDNYYSGRGKGGLGKGPSMCEKCKLKAKLHTTAANNAKGNGGRKY